MMENLLMNNINVYRRIALNSYDDYCENEKKERQINSTFSMGKDGIEYGYMLNMKKYECSVQVIVFSALSLEAFINDLLVKHLGNQLFECLEKLEIKNKIIIGCKMITQKDFPKDKQAYSALVNLIRLRNKLVHAKSKNPEAKSSDVLFLIKKQKLIESLRVYELVVKEIDDLNKDLGIINEYMNDKHELRSHYYLES